MGLTECRALLLSIVVLSIDSARAEFTLNFQPKAGGVIGTTHIHNNLNDNGDPQTGQTPYLMSGGLQLPEIVVDPSNGNSYYHMIVGDLATGFIQESYVQMGFGNYGATALGEPATSASASGGVSTFNRTTTLGNGYDPLDMNNDAIAQASTSGNGSGNPTRVIMRQIISDGEVMIEFLKDKYAYKPRISMLLVAPDITAFFDFDMRNSTYDDALTPGIFTSTINLWGEGVPNESASFDHATEAQNPYITGGMYTYTEGTDAITDDADGKDFGGSNGTYFYTDGGGYDQTTIPWANYMDPLEANPWSFESSKVP